MSTAAPLKRNLVTPTTLVLAALVVVGAYFVAQQFVHGLGAVANINSGYPWGIWVVVDVVIEQYVSFRSSSCSSCRRADDRSDVLQLEIYPVLEDAEARAAAKKVLGK